MKHFESKARADKDHPVLLILDNTYILGGENAIHLFVDKRLQPLETLYVDECDRWLTTNPVRQITHFQVAKILSRVYERYFMMDKGVKTFEIF